MRSASPTPSRGTSPRSPAGGRRVVPVTRRLLADARPPVGVYRKLAGGPGTFLLESAEQGGRVVAVQLHRRPQRRRR